MGETQQDKSAPPASSGGDGEAASMTGIVDYGAGNVSSVERALKAIGAPCVMTRSAAVLSKCDRLIVPGVGEASYAMRMLALAGLDAFLAEWAKANRPLMGICLGSQIIFDHSDEGDTKCLALVPGNVRHFVDVWRDSKQDDALDAVPLQEQASHSIDGGRGGDLKVPHIGWNNLVISNGGTRLLRGADAAADYYFVHSYVMCPDDKSVVKAYTDYGAMVPAVVECGSVTAFQFHPEKSGEAGLDILRKFCKEDTSC